MPIVGSPFLLGSGGQVLDIKSTDAVIRVKAHDTSTVVATKGDVVRSFKAKYKANDDFTCFYLTIPSNLFDSSNEWVITDTYDNETRSINLLINAAYEFSYVVNYNIPSGYTEREYIGYPAVSAVNTYYFTVPNPFAGFTFADRFKIKSEHYWQAQSTDYQGPYGKYSATNTFSLPTTIMRGTSSSGYVEHSIGYTSSGSSGVSIRNISNYREKHTYVFEGIGQDANSDVIPDWVFDKKFMDYDDQLFDADLNKETRTIRYYPLSNITHDHDNGLIIDIPFVSGVTYTCSFTLSTSVQAWIAFRRADNWSTLLGAVDGWSGITSGAYSFSFTPTEDIEKGRLCIYTAGAPWDASEHTEFVEAIISNLSVTASSSNLIVMSSYDDGEVVADHFGHLSSLSYMDTGPSSTFCIGQVGNLSGIRNFSGRMYGMSIDINDQTVLNLIPCQRDSDSAVGFYDRVGKQFHELLTSG